LKKAEDLQTPHFVVAFLMESCDPELKKYARDIANKALYVAPGDSTPRIINLP